MISLLGFMSWNDLCNVHLCSGRRNNEGPWVPETGLVMTGYFLEEVNNLYKLSREVLLINLHVTCNMGTSQYRGTFFCMLSGCNPSKRYVGFQHFTV